MGYVDENLLPGEHVVYRAHLHHVIYFGPIAAGAVALILIIVAAASEGAGALGWVGFFILLIAGIVVLSKYIMTTTSDFAVTNRRVLIKVGAISRHTLELLLQKVEGIGVDQSLFGRMLGYGTIVVTGTGGTKERFPSIADPLEFRRQVQDQTAGGTSAAVAPTQAQAPAPAPGAFCANCGAKSAPGAKFCSSCGRQFATA